VSSAVACALGIVFSSWRNWRRTLPERTNSGDEFQKRLQRMAAEIPVIVVGAGVAGLTAAIDLGRSGVPVIVVEARDRIGGQDRGRLQIAEDFDAPLPENVLRAFEG